MKIYNLIILDASGSMCCIYEEALHGVNETIKTIRRQLKVDNALEQYLTINTFNGGNNYLKTIIECPAQQARPIIASDYSTEGCTALYDAICESVIALRSKLRADDKALVTIITDGMENASVRYTSRDVALLIQEMSQRGVVFTYIGANQDVVLEASKMGIQNAMAWESNSAGTTDMFKKENYERQRWYERVKNGDADFREHFFEEHDANHSPASSAEPYDRYTPTVLTQLRYNEMFVFGSNSKGIHHGGGARYAYKHFGAIMGQSSGPQGQSYAIPTVGVGYDHMVYEIEKFITFATQHPEIHFYVTAIGCGHGGYNVYRVAHHFAPAYHLTNVSLPKAFVDYLQNR